MARREFPPWRGRHPGMETDVQIQVRLRRDDEDLDSPDQDFDSTLTFNSRTAAHKFMERLKCWLQGEEFGDE